MRLLWQVPPPLPPTPAPDAVVISGGPPEGLVIVVGIIVITIVTGIVLYPLFKAFAKRLEGRSGEPVDPMLLDRVADLEHRLAEAEERIDFNERMLAQREPLALPRDKAD